MGTVPTGMNERIVQGINICKECYGLQSCCQADCLEVNTALTPVSVICQLEV